MKFVTGLGVGVLSFDEIFAIQVQVHVEWFQLKCKL
jgi:hypothetical protein